MFYHSYLSNMFKMNIYLIINVYVPPLLTVYHGKNNFLMNVYVTPLTLYEIMRQIDSGQSVMLV